MKQLNDALLAVFNDIVYSQLHRDTKTQVEDAIKRFDVIAPIVQHMAAKGIALDTQIQSAQKHIKWLGFKNPPARMLSREVDMFSPCSNT